MDLKKEIKKYALLNALEFEGKADSKAVLGKVLREIPSSKKNIPKTAGLIEVIIKEVNKLSLKNQEKEIKKFRVKKEKKKKERTELPPLKNAGKEVVMRFAPNPGGALSLGRSRAALLNWFYVEKYKGKYILRMDDTDPKIKPPIKEAYNWIYEDLKWLGIKTSLRIMASKRFEMYDKYAEKLIDQENAYICTCPQDKFNKLKEEGEACPCRDMSLIEQRKRWKSLFSTYKEGDAVVRLKTDIKHRNPALRDYVILKIMNKPEHPFSKAKVWPLYDFASAIDDHLLGITHVIRGTEFTITIEKQGYIYKYLGWKYPECMLVGKLIVGGLKSTSEIRKLIEQGELEGWDDVRLGTLMSLRKRGFQAEAIKEFIKSLRLTKGDIHVSMDILESFNRKIIDKKSDRYFFVSEPIEVEIKGGKRKNAKILLHPDFKKRGYRNLEFKGSVYISKDDLNLIRKNKEIRLKDLFNIKIVKGGSEKIKTKYSGDKVKKIPVIQWLPKEKNIPLTLIMNDGSKKEGLAEEKCKNLNNKIVQFERVGFARVVKERGKLIAYFTHK